MSRRSVVLEGCCHVRIDRRFAAFSRSCSGVCPVSILAMTMSDFLSLSGKAGSMSGNAQRGSEWIGRTKRVRAYPVVDHGRMVR
ncbi:MAG: hypothetical protein ACYC3I_06610 [Gemmataceae bacterium]